MSDVATLHVERGDTDCGPQMRGNQDHLYQMRLHHANEAPSKCLSVTSQTD